MTTSAAGSEIGPLPGPWRALRISGRMAFRVSPLLGSLSFILVPLGWISGTLWSFALARLVDAARGGSVTGPAALLAGIVIGRWLLDAITPRVFNTWEERVGIVLERECLTACADPPGVEHFERPAYLDRFEMVRDEAWIIHWMFEALTEFTGAIVRAGLVVGFLIAIDARMLIAPTAAMLTVGVSVWHQRRSVPIAERARAHKRLARHLFRVALHPDAGMELRVHGAGEWLRSRRRHAWNERFRVQQQLRLQHAGAATLASVTLVAGQAACILIVVDRARAGTSTPGQVLFVISLLVGLQHTVGLVAETGGWLVGCLETSRRFVWLLDMQNRSHISATPPIRELPSSLRGGIGMRGVSFRYPGTERDVLRDINLDLPAGAVVAIVGLNGSGKTTLTKLLLRLYEPTAGEVLVDGSLLASIPPETWRERTTAVLQDFYRADLPLRQAVGIGDLSRADDEEAVAQALHAAGAHALLNLPSGLDTPLGTTWTGGVDLSGGQWQQVATARAAMRTRPLLTILDEPTASLDAQTEHALFARFADAARGHRQTGVVLLVTHRFSTVRMADLIVVLEDGSVTEVGSHRDLIARRGTYAHLYGLQADQYR